LLFLASCALAEANTMAAVNDSAKKQFRYLLLMEFAPVLII
jgi:hypothetical protein